VNSFIRASSKQSNNLEKFQGVFGIVLILGIAIGLSNNRKAIDWRLVGSGLGIQLILALFILKVPIGKTIFEVLGHLIEKVLSYSNQGAEFVFGSLVKPVFGHPGLTVRSLLYHLRNRNAIKRTF
jgi:nucleoside permease NupC